MLNAAILMLHVYRDNSSAIVDVDGELRNFRIFSVLTCECAELPLHFVLGASWSWDQFYRSRHFNEFRDVVAIVYNTLNINNLLVNLFAACCMILPFGINILY